jgi:hypothetical protein
MMHGLFNIVAVAPLLTVTGLNLRTSAFPASGGSFGYKPDSGDSGDSPIGSEELFAPATYRRVESPRQSSPPGQSSSSQSSSRKKSRAPSGSSEGRSEGRNGSDRDGPDRNGFMDSSGDSGEMLRADRTYSAAELLSEVDSVGGDSHISTPDSEDQADTPPRTRSRSGSARDSLDSPGSLAAAMGSMNRDGPWARDDDRSPLGKASMGSNIQPGNKRQPDQPLSPDRRSGSGRHHSGERQHSAGRKRSDDSFDSVGTSGEEVAKTKKQEHGAGHLPDAEWRENAECCHLCQTSFYGLPSHLGPINIRGWLPKVVSGYKYYNRRHHCRRCGHAVCSSCSDQFRMIQPVAGARETEPGMHRVCNRCARELDQIKLKKQESYQKEMEGEKRQVTHETFVARGIVWKREHNEELRRRQKENQKTCTECKKKFVAKHALLQDICDTCMRAQVSAAKERFSVLLQQRLKTIVYWCKVTRVPFWLTVFMMEASYWFDLVWFNIGFGPVTSMIASELYGVGHLFGGGAGIMYHLFILAFNTALILFTLQLTFADRNTRALEVLADSSLPLGDRLVISMLHGSDKVYY